MSAIHTSMIDLKSSPDPPLDCGKRLLPVVVDEIAHSNPDQVFIEVPKSRQIQDCCISVTFLAFSTAISRCAWPMEENVGQSEKPDPLDIRYLIILFAAAKTRNVVCYSLTAIKSHARTHSYKGLL